MKTFFPYNLLLLSCCAMLLFSCEPKEKKAEPKAMVTEEAETEKTGLTDTTKETWPICDQECNYGDEVIPLEEAAIWASDYRTAFPNAPRAFFFSLNSIISMLDYCPDCDGIRVYFGSVPDAAQEGNAYVDAMRMALVGVDEENDQLLTDAMSILGCSYDYTNNLGQSSALNGGETTQNINSWGGFMSTTAGTEITTAWQNGQAANNRTLAAYTFCMDYICGVLSQGEQQAAIGMRFYVGLHEKEDSSFEFRLVMVGVDGEGNDLTFQDEFGSEVVDFAAPCPQYCGTPSPLNNGL